MADRYELVNDWLRGALGSSAYRIEPASSDASFRRYYRVGHGNASYIVMDAPPDKEDCRPFVQIAQALAGIGLNVPRVLQADLEQGLLLLTDLGPRTYFEAVDEHSHERYYDDALSALLLLQTRGTGDDITLPDYDHALLMAEMGLFRDWLLATHLGVTVDEGLDRALSETFEYLAAAALAQPRVWVHRDYHSRNLIARETDNPGVLDFQDAVMGPVTYDLVSLLRDCYIQWPAARVEGWLAAYHRRLGEAGVIPARVDLAQFRLWFDLMGVQRHLKAAGIFARLNHRDGKPGYLKDLPRTLGYVADVCRRHPPLAALDRIMGRHVLPRMQ